MSRRVKWECPSGEHPAVLGGPAPRKNAVVRYCIPCSERSGYLVERRSPALEADRAHRAAVQSARGERARERARVAAHKQRFVPCIEPDGSVGEVDVTATLKRMQKLPAVRGASVFCYTNYDVPFELRRRRDRASTGRAWAQSRIVFSIGQEQPREKVEELILHELLHYVLPDRVHHGLEFRTALMRAAREWWPGITPSWEGHVYRMDAQIWRAARALHGGTVVQVVDWDEDDPTRAAVAGGNAESG